MRRVLLNVVAHVVRWTEAGQVVLRVRTGPAGHVRFEVLVTAELSSTGQRLLEGFLPADPSSAPPSAGTGLGLSISRRLVQAMGGRTGADPGPGRGRTVWFSVPLPVDWFGVALPDGGEADRRSEPPTR